MPQFDISTFPSQVFWLIITFGIFYTISRNGLPAALKQMHARDRHLQELEKKIEHIHRKTLALQEKYTREEEEGLANYKKALQDGLATVSHDLEIYSRTLKAQSIEELDVFEDKLLEKVDLVRKNKTVVANELIQLVIKRVVLDAFEKGEQARGGENHMRKFDA